MDETDPKVVIDARWWLVVEGLRHLKKWSSIERRHEFAAQSQPRFASRAMTARVPARGSPRGRRSLCCSEG